jgi:hypothetical protein
MFDDLLHLQKAGVWLALPHAVDASGKFLSPLLEERVRERGGSLVSVLRSTPHPSPPLKGEGVRRFLKLLYNLFIIIISHFLI